MSTEFKLSYTGSEVNAKLGKIDGLVEAEERLTNEINVERARINQFTSLPDGSTAGDAELQDIRVGYDGYAYETAGEAVRGQVGGLSEDIDAVNEEIGYAVLEWNKGFIDANTGGVNASNTTRLLSNLIAFSDYKELYCVIPSGYQVLSVTYDENENYVGKKYYVEGSQTISPLDGGTYVRLNILNLSSNVAEMSWLDGFSFRWDSVVLEKDLSKIDEKLSKEIDGIYSEVGYAVLDFQYGILNITTGIVINSKERLVSDFIDFADFEITTPFGKIEISMKKGEKPTVIAPAEITIL